MAEQDMNKFERTPHDADSAIDTVGVSPTEVEDLSETTERKDPTLGVIAAEYALWGPLHDGRHVFGKE